MTDTEEKTKELVKLAARVGEICEHNGLQLCTAESCTGGLIAGAITEVAGSSSWFSSGVVTYSNHAKHQLLGVEESVFDQHGAVSEACVVAMAHGALHRFNADLAVSVSGIAGPGGATPGKPVGTVWLAWATRVKSLTSHTSAAYNPANAQVQALRFQFGGTRSQVRQQAVEKALRGIISLTEESGQITV